MQLIWEEFLKIIKEEAGTQVLETWFKAVILERYSPETKTVFLQMPNSFVSNWIQEHYTELIKTHLSRLLHVDQIKLLFITKTNGNGADPKIIPAAALQRQILAENLISKENISTSSYNSTDLVVRNYKPPVANNKNPKKPRKCHLGILNEQYTFESFIVGPNNSLAHAAAFAVSQNLGKVYNPLFIYGGTGLGKTHLLHAIGNEIKRKLPQTMICYECSDQFMNEFIHSIRLDKISQFREKYQKIDLLLLDDIQFFSSKEQTQEIFFHIFNSLNEQGKQIVFSSDTMPKDIAGLQNRLKSRLHSGLVADVQMPDLETKIAILKSKALLHGIDLDNEVANFVASKPVSSIRELEGYLIRLNAFSSLMNQHITLDLARNVIADYEFEGKKNISVEIDNIVKSVAKFYNISTADIRSDKRNKEIALARQVSFYLIKKFTKQSFQAIGSYFGGKDHTTVIHATKKIESLQKNDFTFMQKLKELELNITNSR